MAKKKEKNEAWSRQESFVREIERDTKEKSEQVAQELAQAVCTQEEKQAKRQAARAGARGRSGQAYTQAGTWNAKENSPVRTKISALGETAGGTRPDTDAWGGTTHTGAHEWEKAPGLHTMELRIPGAGLTGTRVDGMMKEISRRVAAAVQPGSLQLQPSPIGPLQKPENLPGFIDETAVPGEGLVPYGVNGAESAVQLLRAAPQNLQAGPADSNTEAKKILFSNDFMSRAQPVFSWGFLESQNEQEAENEKDFWKSVMTAVSEPLEEIAKSFIQPATWFSTRNWQEDYEQNLAHDVRGRPVYGQETDEEASAFQFGEGTGESSGCGAIATYNALYLLGLDPSLANIMKEYRQTGGTVASGAWGTSPFSAPKVLDKYPVDYVEYADMYELDQDMQVGDVAIFSLWNNRNDIRDGYHSFAIQKTEDGYISYNWSSADEEARKMDDIDEVQAGGNFISAYRVRRLPEE